MQAQVDGWWQALTCRTFFFYLHVYRPVVIFLGFGAGTCRTRQIVSSLRRRGLGRLLACPLPQDRPGPVPRLLRSLGAYL
jgi:hypothetical protein